MSKRKRVRRSLNANECATAGTSCAERGSPCTPTKIDKPADKGGFLLELQVFHRVRQAVDFGSDSAPKSLGLCPTRHSLALKLRKHSFSFTHSRHD